MIERRSVEYYIRRVKELIKSYDSTIDVDSGAVLNLIVLPLAVMMDELNYEVVRENKGLFLKYFEELSREMQDDVISNFVYERKKGSYAVGSVFFQATSRPVTDIVIPRGVAVSTDVEYGGFSKVYITTEERRMLLSQIDSYYNVNEGVWEVEVPVRSIRKGSMYNVGVGMVTRMLGIVSGISRVVNKSAIVGGEDEEGGSELVEKLRLLRKSFNSRTIYGLKLMVLGEDNVYDVSIETGIRGEDLSGVDVWVLGVSDRLIEKTDIFRYDGMEHRFEKQPVVEVVSVLVNGVENSDWRLVKDGGVYGNSVRGRDRLGWNVLPERGSIVRVTYLYDGFIENLQEKFDSDIYRAVEDILFRRGYKKEVYINYILYILRGFDKSVVKKNVDEVIMNYVNSLRLGERLERADVIYEVKKVSGVDNIVFNDFRLVEDLSGVVRDIDVKKSEYLRLRSENLVGVVV